MPIGFSQSTCFPAASAWYSERFGLSLNELVADYKSTYGHAVLADDIRSGHHRIFPTTINRVSRFHTIVDIALAHSGKLPLAVASGGDVKIVHMILGHLQIAQLFDVIVGIGDLRVGKPEPHLFLDAARQLRLRPEQCFVYEETDEGMTAAKRAGMRYVDVAPYRAT